MSGRSSIALGYAPVINYIPIHTISYELATLLIRQSSIHKNALNLIDLSGSYMLAFVHTIYYSS